MAASLRSVREDDWPAIVELSRRAVARPEEQVGNPVWTTRDELESELADWDVDPTETLLVEEGEDGEVVGFGGVEVLRGFDHIELYGPLVAPAARGQKIGARLLEASIDLARRHRGERLVTAVGARNAGGRLLLEHHGFQRRGPANAVFRLAPGMHRPVSEGPDGVSVRRGRPRDLDAALRLYRECFPDGRFPDEFWANELERGGIYLAEADGEPVAVLDVDASDRWIYHVCVTTSEREHGVGSFLVSEALSDYWASHPGETLGLSVAADNVPAMRLYRRQGFAPWLVLQSLELPLA